MSIQGNRVVTETTGDEFGHMVSEFEYIVSRLRDQRTYSDLNWLTQPDWPFTHEGFQHKYKCTICGKVIECY